MELQKAIYRLHELLHVPIDDLACVLQTLSIRDEDRHVLQRLTQNDPAYIGNITNKFVHTWTKEGGTVCTKSLAPVAHCHEIEFLGSRFFATFETSRNRHDQRELYGFSESPAEGSATCIWVDKEGQVRVDSTDMTRYWSERRQAYEKMHPSSTSMEP